ncbi:MAG: T9SS type A sorting domain-containing protein [Ignavibacteria bacterium]|nr:T9SS type A sorting domain-containing protein [Ignavibacteria bacterium]
MKKLVLSMVTLLMSVSLFAQSPSVSLNIHGLCAGKPLVLNSNVASMNDSYYFSISMMRYYITGISIIHDGGQMDVVPDGVILVDEADPTVVNLGRFPVKNIEGIKFFIGVDQARNHLDPTTYPEVHPLAPKNPTMHWGWTPGYRFVTLEGKAGSSQMNVNTGFQIHSLGDELYGSVTVPLQLTVMGIQTTIDLYAEYGNLLKGIDVTQGPVSHASTGISKTLITNFLSSVFSSSNTAAVNKDATQIVSVFPNPSADQVVVNAPDVVGVARLVNAAGVTVQTQSFSGEATFNTSALSNGTCTVVLQSKQGVVSTHRVVVAK